jgi:hypothetical protein
MFGGIESDRSRFRRNRGCRCRLHVLRPGLVFGGTEGVVSLFRVLRSLICFWQYRWRRLPFSSPVFMFFPPRVVFDGNEGVSS